ncbi:SanA/YdcF family protein [Maribacter thermophilus]|uniref:SanA/YdcF family protein n=1 Tax=Maribacter thermophilus TaxID=1197874 RepID=UPI000641302B|nr:ElyC/SanA/YdcF family protein [Maribacter thermophilus]
MKSKLLKFTIVALSIPLLALIICNYIINSFGEGKTYSSVQEVPKNKVGLILGTAKKLKGGAPNPYYANRITATIALYKAGKIDYVLVSGDNGSIYYNEPTTIKNDLVDQGIPSEKIFLDYAGFRTLDSMVRAKEVFGLNELTVISQKFHNERAIYLAYKNDLKAIGFNAEDISLESGLKVQFREYFARVKVFIDLILKTRPKFIGDKIKIE